MMHAQMTFGLAAMLLVNTLPVVGQLAPSSPSRPVIEDKAPTGQQGVIKVMITPVAWSRKDNRYVTNERFKVGEPIRFGVTVVLPKARNVFLTSPFLQNRPMLVKDGKPVPPLREFNDNPECILIRVADLTVPANRPTGIDLFNVADFYAPLKPGEYQLTLSRLLNTCTGEFYKSEPVKFWVTP